MLERSLWFRTTLVVVVLSAAIYLFGALGRLWSFLGDLLLIFFFAYLIGSLLIHLINSLTRVLHMPRPVAILLVYMTLITMVSVLIVMVIPTMIHQVEKLVEEVPGFADRAPELIGRVETFILGFGITLDIQGWLADDRLSDLTDRATGFLGERAIPILQRVASTAFAITLVLLLSFYIVLDGGRRLNEALKVLPPRAEHEARYILGTIDQTFHGYVRGLLVISLIYGVGTAVVMTATGLPAALPVALLSSVLLAVPFVGDWLALALPLIVAAVSGDFVTFIIVLSVLLFIQQVMLNLLTPRILGHAVRMPAMLVIVAVVVGARLAGIPGALLGVPTVAVLYTISVHYGMGIRRRREARNQAEAAATAALVPAERESEPARRPAPSRSAAARRTTASAEPTPPSEPAPIAGAAPPRDDEA